MDWTTDLLRLVMARYDEDLHENLFFQTLIGKYSSLFQQAADQRYLVSHAK